MNEPDNWKSNIGDTLEVRVTPKASSNRIGIETDTEGKTIIRIYITTVSESGKANRAVIALLSKELGLAKSTFTIIRGLTGRDKTIHIDK